MTVQFALIENATITPAELVSRARSLTAILAGRAVKTEADRRVDGSSLDEIIGAGLLRTLVPRRWGGWEFGHEAAFNIAVELGAGCGSTGWYASLFMNATWWLANFPDEAQHDVWRDSPDRKMGVSLAPNGTAQSESGGFRLSGHWSWVSGVDHSDWAILGARLSDAPSEIRHFLIPRADFDIRDTWFNVGLRGSGSNDVIVDEVFVPAHRTLSMHDFREGTTPGALVNPGADYRIPMIAAMPLCLCGPLLGIGRGAFRRWLEWTSGRTATASGDAVANSLRVQLRATQSEAELDAADLLLRRNLSSLSDGHPVDLAIRSRNFAAYGVAAQFVCNAIDGLFNISGAHGLRDGMDIQRAWRDAHAIAAHTGLNAENSGQVRGQYLLGIPRNPKLRVF